MSDPAAESTREPAPSTRGGRSEAAVESAAAGVRGERPKADPGRSGAAPSVGSASGLAHGEPQDFAHGEPQDFAHGEPQDPGAAAAERKMREHGQPEEAIRSFLAARARLIAGERALLPSDELEPADDVPKLEELAQDVDREALRRVALIKLNGGLATTMGLRQPKSLVMAREGRTFLEIIAAQAQALRRRFQIPLPVVLMNSEATRSAMAPELERHADLCDGLPPAFEQSMVPKLDASTLAPISWPPNPALEWCPPGHGDVYGALRRSGLLEAMLERGFRYAMISNCDNLGATLDERIATHLAAERIPFLMEVVEGTEAERKGGHIARRRADGRLVLRETAQVPPEDEDSFRDFRRWRYYNTNNLWVDLRALAELVDEHGGLLPLPLIVNRKTVDPRDPDSPPVLQLESAMGAAIGSFPGARLLLVPRTRFIPVKTTDDLLVMRSDAWSLDADMRPRRAGVLPYVELDKRYYRLLDQFERRFPAGPPSLREAKRLVVRGDVTFGRGVVVRGEVELDAREPLTIADGTVLAEGSSVRKA
jgi:UTP--glucose-1-phosphate uridylyltransferase